MCLLTTSYGGFKLFCIQTMTLGLHISARKVNMTSVWMWDWKAFTHTHTVYCQAAMSGLNLTLNLNLTLTSTTAVISQLHFNTAAVGNRMFHKHVHSDPRIFNFNHFGHISFLSSYCVAFTLSPDISRHISPLIIYLWPLTIKAVNPWPHVSAVIVHNSFTFTELHLQCHVSEKTSGAHSSLLWVLFILPSRN